MKHNAVIIVQNPRFGSYFGMFGDMRRTLPSGLLHIPQWGMVAKHEQWLRVCETLRIDMAGEPFALALRGQVFATVEADAKDGAYPITTDPADLAEIAAFVLAPVVQIGCTSILMAPGTEAMVPRLQEALGIPVFERNVTQRCNDMAHTWDIGTSPRPCTVSMIIPARSPKRLHPRPVSCGA